MGQNQVTVLQLLFDCLVLHTSLLWTRKPSCRWQTRATREHMPKIAPIRSPYNVVADNIGTILSSFV